MCEDKNLLYSCESVLDESVYQRMYSCFPEGYRKILALYTFFIFFITMGYGLRGYSTALKPLILFGVLEAIVLIYIYLGRKRIARNSYRQLCKKGFGNRHYKNEFYEDCFVVHGKESILQFEYSFISKVVETDADIFLKCKDGVRALQKESCQLELITFLKETCSDRWSFCAVKPEKPPVQVKRPKFVKAAQIFLLLLTFMCVLGFMITNILISVTTDIREPLSMALSASLWLPIPVTAILVGYRYERTEFGYKILIWSGYVVGIILLTTAIGGFLFF